MKKILKKSGKSQGILSEEKSGNPGHCYQEELIFFLLGFVLFQVTYMFLLSTRTHDTGKEFLPVHIYVSRTYD